MQTIEYIKDKLKLDFTKTVVLRDCSSGTDDNFQIQPRNFLSFAKTDFLDHDEKGLINALTNAKRAIDCQIDTAFYRFGINYDEIPDSANKILNYVNLKNSNLAFKLKLIKALNFAPSGLISKLRTLRNKLEHYYKIPSRSEVEEAVELAELFILSIENRVRLIADNFLISDENNLTVNWKFKNFIQFQFENKEFVLSFYIDNKIIGKKIFKKDDFIFYPLIRMFNNINEEIDFIDSLKIFLRMIEHPIPQKNIKLRFE